VSQAQYLFGESESAAQRLRLLARVYQESTRAFLAKAAGAAHFPSALDLGCGLGFTSHLIAGTLQCDKVVGLDASAGFIAWARVNSHDRVSLVQHDITTIPFPTGRANLIFSRFLLTHLRDPAGVVAEWTTQLESSGLLLLEETEAVHATHPAFARYLETVEGLLSSQSNQLYAGRVVAGLKLPDNLRQTMNELRPLAVRSADAARMFLLNLQSWKQSEFIRANYSEDEISGLSER
jgi:SAM-dependent methyltransferase